MAISSGRESGAVVIKRYTGIGTVKVLSVCPSNTELGAIQNREIAEPIQYTSTIQDENGKNISCVRIGIVIQTVNDGIEMNPIVASFFLRRTKMLNQDKSKVKVMDAYNQTAWVTKEELEHKAIPMYKNGPAPIDPNYRPLYEGEEALMLFIRNILNIPNVRRYNSKEKAWYKVSDPENCECRLELEELDKLFKGDFTQLREIIQRQPNNHVKMLFGIRTNNEGKQYTDVYTRMTLKEAVNDYSKLQAEVVEAKQRGAMQNTYYEFTDIHEYAPKPTNFDPEAAGHEAFDDENSSSNDVDDLPFSNSDTNDVDW